MYIHNIILFIFLWKAHQIWHWVAVEIDQKYSNFFCFFSFSFFHFSSSHTHLSFCAFLYSAFTFHYNSREKYSMQNNGNSLVSLNNFYIFLRPMFFISPYNFTDSYLFLFYFWHLKDVNQISILMTFLMTKIYYWKYFRDSHRSCFWF